MTGDSEETTNGHVVSRRSAMQLLTALAGAGAFSGSAVAEEDEGQQTERENRDSEKGPAPPVGTEQLLEYLAAKYGDILSEEDVESLQDDVADNVRYAQAMDDVDLENGDDMALAFEAYRGSY